MYIVPIGKVPTSPTYLDLMYLPIGDCLVYFMYSMSISCLYHVYLLLQRSQRGLGRSCSRSLMLR